MPVDDVWQVTNEFEYQGNPNSYNWHLQVSVEGDAEGVGDDMLTFWSASSNSVDIVAQSVCAFPVRYSTATISYHQLATNDDQRSCQARKPDMRSTFEPPAGSM